MADMKYQAHQYSGKENGMMVISSKEGLVELSKQIESGVQDPRNFGQVASVDIGKKSEYILSFHVQGSEGLPGSNVPSGAASGWILFICFPLIILGAMQVLHWLAGIL